MHPPLLASLGVRRRRIEERRRKREFSLLPQLPGQRNPERRRSPISCFFSKPAAKQNTHTHTLPITISVSLPPFLSFFLTFQRGRFFFPFLFLFLPTCDNVGGERKEGGGTASSRQLYNKGGSWERERERGERQLGPPVGIEYDIKGEEEEKERKDGAEKIDQAGTSSVRPSFLVVACSRILTIGGSTLSSLPPFLALLTFILRLKGRRKKGLPWLDRNLSLISSRRTNERTSERP